MVSGGNSRRTSTGCIRPRSTNSEAGKYDDYQQFDGDFAGNRIFIPLFFLPFFNPVHDRTENLQERGFMRELGETG